MTAIHTGCFSIKFKNFKQFFCRKPGPQSTHSAKITGCFILIWVRVFGNNLTIITRLTCRVQNATEWYKVLERHTHYSEPYVISITCRKVICLIYRWFYAKAGLFHQAHDVASFKLLECLPYSSIIIKLDDPFCGIHLELLSIHRLNCVLFFYRSMWLHHILLPAS